MRKHQQKQVLELIQTLREAAAEIRRFFVDKDFPSVMSLLGDCQDVAISIGEYIENIEGEGTKTVTLLEDFCEDLYQISTQLETVETSSIKKLDKSLITIENCVKKELSNSMCQCHFLKVGSCSSSPNIFNFVWNFQVHYLIHSTRWCTWLRHCATSRKVAGLIPDGVIFIDIIVPETLWPSG